MAKKNTTKKSSKEAVVEEPKTIEEIKEEVIAETKNTESENTKAVEEEEVEAVKTIVEDTNKNVNEEKTETKRFNSHMFGYSWNGVEMDW